MSVPKFLIGFLFVSQIISAKSIYAQDRNFSLEDSCHSHIEVYSRYWQKDSLGKNGFRELMANTLLGKCSFSGEEWKEIKKSLGSPNFSYNNEGTKTYRYRLNYLSKNIKDVGTMLLDVKVDEKGFVIGISIFTVDG